MCARDVRLDSHHVTSRHVTRINPSVRPSVCGDDPDLQKLCEDMKNYGVATASETKEEDGFKSK